MSSQSRFKHKNIVYHCKHCRLPENKCFCRKHLEEHSQAGIPLLQNRFVKTAGWLLGLGACVSAISAIPNTSVDSNNPVQPIKFASATQPIVKKVCKITDIKPTTQKIAGSKTVLEAPKKQFVPYNYPENGQVEIPLAVNEVQSEIHNNSNNTLTKELTTDNMYVTSRNMGYCTAISKDGKWMITGARTELGLDSNGNIVTCGAVYIYQLQEKPQLQNQLNSQNQKLLPSHCWVPYGHKLQIVSEKESTCLFQGTCVAINANGTVIAFSGQSPYEGQDADQVMVPNLFVFRRNDELKCFVEDTSAIELAQKQLVNQHISCMSLDDSGNILAFGLPFARQGLGQVDLWFYNQGCWTLNPKGPSCLIPEVIETNDGSSEVSIVQHFGWSVQVCGAGNLVCVGAPNHEGGRVYLFEWDESKIENPPLEENREEGILLQEVDKIYNELNATFEQRILALEQPPVVQYGYVLREILTCPQSRQQESSHFGTSVAVDKAGDRCFVYSPNFLAGPQVYIYSRKTPKKLNNNITKPTNETINTNEYKVDDSTLFKYWTSITVCESFGFTKSPFSISCNASGKLLVVGYECYNHKSGIVRLYNQQEKTLEWNCLQTIECSKTKEEIKENDLNNSVSASGFCTSVTDKGTQLVIGGYLAHEGNGTNYYYIFNP